MLKRFGCIIICILVSLLCVSCNTKNEGTKESQNATNFETEIHTDAQFAEITSYGKYVKVSLINPGLDTFEMQTLLYSADDNTEKANVKHCNGRFSTGVTENGFFAVDELNKQVYLYNSAGEEVLSETVKTDAEFFATSYIDTSGKYLMYNNPETREIVIYDLNTKENFTVGKAGVNNIALGFFDGNFYIKSDTSGLLKTSLAERDLVTVFDDTDLSIVTMYGGASSGSDMRFKYIDAAQPDNYESIPYCKVDELAISVIPEGIVTVTSRENGDILRIYGKETAKMREIALNGTYIGCCATDNDNLTVISKTDYGFFAKNYNITELNLLEISAAYTDIPTESAVSSDTTQVPDSEKVDTSSDISSESEISTDITNASDTEQRENGHIISNVPLIAQNPQFPTGCESVTAVMALNFAGYDITVDDFVDKYLPKSEDFTYTDGKKYGPSPHEYFIGNPRNGGSFGCYSEVIAAAVKNYNPNIVVENLNSSEISELCEKYIDKDIPVIMWATISMAQSYNSEKWTLPDGTDFCWRSNEHCLLLIGYDENYYYFNDPYTAKTVNYEKALVEKRYLELSKQALAIL